MRNTFTLVSGVLICVALASFSFIISESRGGPPVKADGSIFFAHSVFVATSGDNSTALRQRLDKSFASVFAAAIAAQLGNTMIVLPRTYFNDDTITPCEGVTFQFLGSGSILIFLSHAPAIQEAEFVLQIVLHSPFSGRMLVLSRKVSSNQ